MPSPNELKWTGIFIGRPDLVQGTGGVHGASGPPAKLPRPMEHDCKIVRGRVPGPKNFVLCATHKHILDTDKKQIIAEDVNAFNAAHPEFGKLPVAMMADCVIVRDKVPGPKHHVLCKTHDHVVDEEQKQIIAHSLREYIRNGLAKAPTTGSASATGSAPSTGSVPSTGSASSTGSAQSTGSAPSNDPKQGAEAVKKMLAQAVGHCQAVYKSASGFHHDPAVQVTANHCMTELMQMVSVMGDANMLARKLETKVGALAKIALSDKRALAEAAREVGEDFHAVADIIDAFAEDPVNECLSRKKQALSGDPARQKSLDQLMSAYQASLDRVTGNVIPLINDLDELRGWFDERSDKG
jgi:hypothetical protein